MADSDEPDNIWDEYDWERFLQQQDRKTEKYMELLERYIAFKSAPGNQNAHYHPDSHLPGTYRGGMVARLQKLLVPQADGTIAPAPAASFTENRG